MRSFSVILLCLSLSSCAGPLCMPTLEASQSFDPRRSLGKMLKVHLRQQGVGLTGAYPPA